MRWPVRVDPSGEAGPTRAQSRGKGWRTSSRGLFVPSHIDAQRPEQRICEAAAVLPRVGGVTGWGALRWQGGYWFGGSTSSGALRPVTLSVPGKAVAARPQIALSQERLGRDEVSCLDGVRLVDACRAVAYEVRYAASLWDAVEIIDMAAYSDLVSIEELLLVVAVMNGWTGIERLRRAVALARENSWSPRETWLRLVWILLAGLDPPLCNVPVFDRGGRLIGVPDLLDPVTGEVGEYDGGQHLEAAQRRRDIARQEAFRGVGLEVVVVMSGESSDDVARRLVTAHVNATRRGPSVSERAWTLDAPHWWVCTETVAQRRALDESQRRRWLRYRRELP